MISIVKYLSEAGRVGDVSTYEPQQQGPVTGAVKYWTGIRSRADVKEAQDQAAFDKAKALAKLRAEHTDALSKVKKAGSALSDTTSGSEAAGHALKKGAQAAGEAAGSFGKKAAEFAGEHPAAAGIAAGMGAAALLLRRKKAQMQQ